MGKFNNKIVWITGASSGIGEALAVAFAAEGAKLILSARREDELKRVASKTGLSDDKVLVLPMDVSETANAVSKYQAAIAKFGKVDVLVNNAGLSHWSKINDTGMDVIERIMSTNFLGGVALTKAVLPDMLNQKAGQIVVISSVLGKIVTHKQAAYNASKHALHGFYDTLRAEYGKNGIKVLLVCPGFVNTNVAVNSLNRDGKPIGKNNKMIENGLAPDFVAQKIVSAVHNECEEIIIAGMQERIGVWMKRFFPAIFSKFISNSKMV